MSIASEISALTADRNNIRSALAEKGVSAGMHGFDDFANDIGNIPAGTPWDGSYSFVARVIAAVSGEGGSVSGGGLVDVGSNVTVTATPDATHVFSKWVDENGVTLSQSAAYTFLVSADTKVFAVFAQKKITVKLTGTGNTSYCYATINGTKRYGSGTYEVDPGSTITFGVYGRSNTYPGWVKVDDESILNVTSQSTKTVEWEIPSNVSAVNISFSYTSTSSQRRGQITVTTN